MPTGTATAPAPAVTTGVWELVGVADLDVADPEVEELVGPLAVPVAAAAVEDDDDPEDDADADDDAPPAPAASTQLPSAKLSVFCCSTFVKPLTMLAATLWISIGTLLTTASISACELVLMVEDCSRTVAQAPALWILGLAALRLSVSDCATVCRLADEACSVMASLTLMASVPCTVEAPEVRAALSAWLAASRSVGLEKEVAAALRAESEADTEDRTFWMVARSRSTMTRLVTVTRVGVSSVASAVAPSARRVKENFIVGGVWDWR